MKASATISNQMASGWYVSDPYCVFDFEMLTDRQFAAFLPRLLATIMFMAFLGGGSDVSANHLLSPSTPTERATDFFHLAGHSFSTRSTRSKTSASINSHYHDYELRATNSSYQHTPDEFVSRYSESRLLAGTTSSDAVYHK